MKEIDYIYGMNYIEQFRSNLSASTIHNGGVAFAVKQAERSGFTKGAFGYMRAWSTTRQGRDVWERRYGVWMLLNL